MKKDQTETFNPHKSPPPFFVKVLDYLRVRRLYSDPVEMLHSHIYVYNGNAPVHD